MKAFAELGSTGADVLRTEVPAALDETRNKINDWAGPELMKARVHDATVAMSWGHGRFLREGERVRWDGHHQRRDADRRAGA
jgi:hypothetical protein